MMMMMTMIVVVVAVWCRLLTVSHQDFLLDGDEGHEVKCSVRADGQWFLLVEVYGLVDRPRPWRSVWKRSGELALIGADALAGRPAPSLVCNCDFEFDISYEFDFDHVLFAMTHRPQVAAPRTCSAAVVASLSRWCDYATVAWGLAAVSKSRIDCSMASRACG